jgi:hypothetical protein
VQTATTAHQGSIVSAGPSTGADAGMGGGPGGPGAAGGRPPAGEDPPSGVARDGQGGGTGGGSGGGPGETASSPELTALLASAGTRWSAATVSAQSSSTLELSSSTAVMAIGGFSGSDAAPSLAQFQASVAAGDIRYFIASGRGVGGTTVYDLTAPTS